MTRQHVVHALAAAVAAIPLSLPTAAAQSTFTYVGPMDTYLPNGPTSLPLWSTSVDWASPTGAAAPGATGTLDTAVFANVNQPFNSNLPHGGQIAVQVSGVINLGTLTIQNNVFGADIFGAAADGQSGGTINFAAPGSINLDNAFGYINAPDAAPSAQSNLIWCNLSAPSGLTIWGGANPASPGNVWLGGDNNAVNGLSLINVNVSLIDDPQSAYSPFPPPAFTAFSSTPYNADDYLGAQGSTVTLNGAGIFLLSSSTTPSAFTSNLNYKIAPAGGTISTIGYSNLPAFSYAGNFTGTGSLNFVGPAVLSSQTPSTFSGTLHFMGDADDRLAPGTSFPGVQNINLEGTLILDASTNAAPKLNSPAIQMTGGRIIVQGNPSAPYSESLGTLTLSGGLNSISIAPAPGGASVSLAAAAILRQNDTHFYVDAYALGGIDPRSPSTAPPYAGASFITLAIAPAMIGGGGSSNFAQSGGTPAYSTNVSIIPWAFGNADQTAAAPASAGSLSNNDADFGTGFDTPLTYGNGGIGLRPLYVDYANASGNDEFIHSLTGAGAGSFSHAPTSNDNVFLTTSDTGTPTINLAGATVNCNSLTVSNASFSNSLTAPAVSISDGSINIAGGALLLDCDGGNIAANINFGSADGVILASDPNSGGYAQISGVIRGTTLSIGGSGVLYLSGNNTFNGPTYLNACSLILTQNILPNVAGPLGDSSQPIYLATGSTAPAGAGRSILYYDGGGSLTIGRPVIVADSSTDSEGAYLLNPTSGFFNFTNTLTLAPQTRLSISGNATFSGGITGSGIISPLVTATVGLAGNNTWTGGIDLKSKATAAFFFSSDNAFGTGTLVDESTAADLQFNAVGTHTISNPIDIQSTVHFDDPEFIQAAIADPPPASDTRPITLAGPVTLDPGATLLPYDNSVQIDRAFGYGFMQLLATKEDSNLGEFAGTPRPDATTGTIVLAGNNLGGQNGNGNLTGLVQVGDSQQNYPGGVLVAAATDALGSAIVQIQAQHGALQLNAGSVGGSITLPNALFVSGDGPLGKGAASFGVIENVQGTNTITGNIVRTSFSGFGNEPLSTTPDIAIQVDAASTLTITGALTHAADLASQSAVALITRGTGTLIVNRFADTQAAVSTTPGSQITPASTPAPLFGLNIQQGYDQIAPGAGTLGTSWLAANQDIFPTGLILGPAATLDLTDHGMVIAYPSSPLGSITPNGAPQSYPAGSINSYLQSAADPDADGIPRWDHPGLTSSLARADFNYIQATGVGAIDNAELANADGSNFTGSSFLGVPIAANNNLLIRYTYYGDTNLDGIVDGIDVTNLQMGLSQMGDGWLYGDFNYDGQVNATDVALLILGFEAQGEEPVESDSLRAALALDPISPADAAWLLSEEEGLTPAQISRFESMVGVPEPSAAGAALILGLLTRRRRSFQ